MAGLLAGKSPGDWLDEWLTDWVNEWLVDLLNRCLAEGPANVLYSLLERDRKWLAG